MNRRHIIVVVVVLAILTVTVWHERQSAPEHVVLPTPSKNSTDATGSNGSKRIQKTSAQIERDAVVKEKLIAYAKSNNALIAYYGRVVDQDSKPLKGVAVEYTVHALPKIPVPWGPDETTKGSCVTDHNGLFSVEGMLGTSLYVTGLSKTGYRKSGYYKQGGVRYEPYSPQRHIPDRDKPVEFMLIRDDLPKAEEAFNQQLRFNWNAESTIKDLGQNVGKLEFTASRKGRDKTNTIKKFEWEVKMRTMGFTLAKLPDENSRIAPLEGYGPNARVGFSPEEKTWKIEVSERYAIRTDSGIYGLMDLRVYGGGNDGSVSGRVTVFLNKSGARNLDHK